MVSEDPGDSLPPLFDQLEDVDCQRAIEFQYEDEDVIIAEGSLPLTPDLTFSFGAPEATTEAAKFPGSADKKKSFTDLSAIRNYILSGAYPVDYSKTQKRALRTAMANFSVGKDEVLYYKNSKQVVETDVQKWSVIRSAHVRSLPDGRHRHFGNLQTRETVLGHYFWYSVTRDVNWFIANCRVCTDVFESRKSLQVARRAKISFDDNSSNSGECSSKRST